MRKHKPSGFQLAMDPERERAVNQIVAFSILAHANATDRADEAEAASDRLRKLGVKVEFDRPGGQRP